MDPALFGGPFFYNLKQRVNIYVDGFNFYFGLRSKRWKKYYWLDLVKFFETFIKEHQQLEHIYYFSAIQKNRGKSDRQDLFFSANKINSRFTLILGKFLRKNKEIDGHKYVVYEEKQTDVNIAVEMIRNVVQDKCDVSIIVSADSDLIPPIRLIRELDENHRIFVYFPPKRYSRDLEDHCDARFNLERYETRFKSSLLPDVIELKNGYKIKRPESWK